MRLLYQGHLHEGTTSLQRAAAFARIPRVEVVQLDVGVPFGCDAGLYARLRWKLGRPVDSFGENERLLQKVADERPDAVVVDGSKVISCSTLAKLRRLGVRCLAYYSSDDIMGPHNLSRPLEKSLPEWDIVFTTKTFNLPELRAARVRNPVLVGKAFDPELHRPLSPSDVGDEFERFDLVFAGAHEKQRRHSLNALAEAGFTVVIYGGTAGAWPAVHPGIEMREAWFAHDYTRALHTGKIALCFLRKISRDRITQRTMEIAAMGRAMLAEKTDEHDAHFVDGAEYVGFTSDDDLVVKARALLADQPLRTHLARAARERCRRSSYSSDDRAREMLSAIAGIVRP